jgi:hypothetical protein
LPSRGGVEHGTSRGWLIFLQVCKLKRLVPLEVGAPVVLVKARGPSAGVGPLVAPEVAQSVEVLWGSGQEGDGEGALVDVGGLASWATVGWVSPASQEATRSSGTPILRAAATSVRSIETRAQRSTAGSTRAGIEVAMS